MSIVDKFFCRSNSARGGWSTELSERITDRSTKFSSSRTKLRSSTGEVEGGGGVARKTTKTVLKTAQSEQLPGQWGSDIAFIAEARFLCANRVRDAVERVAGNTVNLPNSWRPPEKVSTFRRAARQMSNLFDT